MRKYIYTKMGVFFGEKISKNSKCAHIACRFWTHYMQHVSTTVKPVHLQVSHHQCPVGRFSGWTLLSPFQVPLLTPTANTNIPSYSHFWVSNEIPCLSGTTTGAIFGRDLRSLYLPNMMPLFDYPWPSCHFSLDPSTKICFTQLESLVLIPSSLVPLATSMNEA